MFRTLRKVQKLCNLIKNYSETCRIFYKLWGVRKNVWDTQKGPKALLEPPGTPGVFVQLLQLHKNHLGTPGTPGVFEKYLQAWQPDKKKNSCFCRISQASYTSRPWHLAD